MARKRTKRLPGYGVYFIRDPRDGSLKYIGMTMNFSARRNAHINTQSYGVLYKWVCELRELGMVPVFEPKFWGLTKEQAMRCETILQSHHKGKIVCGSRSRIHDPRVKEAEIVEWLPCVNSSSLVRIVQVAQEILERRASRGTCIPVESAS